MKNLLTKHIDCFVGALLGVGVFLFWWLGYPQALSYQEQNQLFLWTGDYFVNDVRIIGGFADWLGEFFTQFYYIEWLGAAVLGLIYAVFYVLAVHTIDEYKLSQSVDSDAPGRFEAASFALIPVALLLGFMGDECVLLSYVMAIILSMSTFLLLQFVERKSQTSLWWADIVVVPALYWLAGPMAWLYAALRAIYSNGWKKTVAPAIMLIVHLLAVRFVLTQWPLLTAICGTNYYRRFNYVEELQIIIPAIIAVFAFVMSFRKWTTSSVSPKMMRRVCVVTVTAVAAIISFQGVIKGFEKEKYELINQDYLIRNERWNDVLANAEKTVVPVNFWSESVNLSLSMTGQLSNRMFSFFQSGTDALIMGMVRDNTSNLPTMEAFYRLGMVNESMRYASDIQESIMNGKKSGRFTKRIAECCIISGRYEVARKNLDLLEKSLFYRDWAKDAKTYLGNEAWIDAHPQWGRLRKFGFKTDFLYNYGELDKVLGQLFISNPENKMALEYFLGQLLLIGDMKSFAQYLSWAQQYGGYPSMPAGYADAWNCIQNHGNVPGSPFAEYARRLSASAQQMHNDMEQSESLH